MTRPNLYDVVPFPSQAHPEAHPDRLLTLAHALGCEVADPEGLRVLDLGCGTGTQLMAVARDLPDATLLGLDQSAVQVQIARDRAAAAGLTNVRFEQADLRSVPLSTYDVILCQGTWSWVDDATQDAILERIRAHLAHNGVALISYNTLPGWHMLGMVRGVLRYHTRNASGPDDAVKAARTFLRFLRDATAADGDAHAAWIHTVDALLTEVPDAYLLHEYLEDVNRPIYFHRFAERLQAHGLAWLSEARPAQSRTDAFPADVRAVLDAERARRKGSQVHVEQCMDFLRNKRFRTSLIGHGQGHSTPRLHPDRIARAFLRGEHDAAERDEAGRPALRGHTGWVMPLQDATDEALAHHLNGLGPSWCAVAALPDLLGVSAVEVHERLCRWWAHDLLDLRRTPPAPSAPPRAQPEASALVRIFAETDEQIPTRFGGSVPVDTDARALLRDCDGSRDHSALATRWNARLADDERLRADALPDAIATLHRRGLLGG